MRVFFLSLTLFLFSIFSVQGQSSLNFTSPDKSYRNGTELLNQGKYLSASKSFEKYLGNGSDPLKLADSEYFIAFCALQLKNQGGAKTKVKEVEVARNAGRGHKPTLGARPSAPASGGGGGAVWVTVSSGSVSCSERSRVS